MIMYNSHPTIFRFSCRTNKERENRWIDAAIHLRIVDRRNASIANCPWEFTPTVFRLFVSDRNSYVIHSENTRPAPSLACSSSTIRMITRRSCLRKYAMTRYTARHKGKQTSADFVECYTLPDMKYLTYQISEEYFAPNTLN